MKTLLTPEQLSDGVERLAAEIGAYYRDRPLTLIGVLTGSVVMIADLMRRLELPLKIGFVQASSYRGQDTQPGSLAIHADFLPDLHGQDVLVVDDIFDTGRTLSRLVLDIKIFGAASVRSAVLLRKHGRREVGLEPDHVGFEIPNEFVVGYGLDYDNAYRNLPYVAALEASELTPLK
ncbi:MAG TPA: hypoxanthine phosphoribosyltransferase [Pirellulales bacterium]|nr:hypoxanthine phosphoribosyltransferase [Pirellulales bacterium]